jgi:hypothetical protein
MGGNIVFHAKRNAVKIKTYNAVSTAADFLLVRRGQQVVGLILNTEYRVTHTDISQYRLRFGFSLLYTDRVPLELLDSAALL